MKLWKLKLKSFSILEETKVKELQLERASALRFTSRSRRAAEMRSRLQIFVWWSDSYTHLDHKSNTLGMMSSWSMRSHWLTNESSLSDSVDCLCGIPSAISLHNRTDESRCLAANRAPAAVAGSAVIGWSVFAESFNNGGPCCCWCEQLPFGVWACHVRIPERATRAPRCFSCLHQP